MKKIFTFIAAMLVAFAVNAATTQVAAGSGTLKAAVEAAAAGDILVLADGDFVEGNQIVFDKNLTVEAAEGAHPVVAVRWYSTIVSGAQVSFRGICFDGATKHFKNGDEMVGASDHCFRSHDASNGTEQLTFIGCEFKGYPNYVLYAQRGDRRMDAITIRNCYFHDNVRSAIYVGYDAGHTTNLACNSVTIENSTFANFTNVGTALIYIANAGTAAADQVVRVDHCTFYNFVKNTGGDYTFIDVRKSTDVQISNCIFAQPEADMSKATYCYGGTISNCLSYNTTGHHSGPTTNNNIVGNPLFADAANADYTLEEGSPALGAGTDGSNLGDPFWWPREIYFYNDLGWTAPHVNFYKGSYWSDSDGSGNYTTSPKVGKPNVAMTQVGTSNVWKANYSGLYHYVSFTSESQTNMGNFWSIAGASYRGDFDPESEWNMFVPNTTSNGTYNGVNYYSNGLWAPYTITYADLNYKTLCLPVGGTLTGANAYEVTAVDDVNGVVTLSDATTTLTAGVAYIIKPTANTISIAYAGAPVFTGVMNYLRGNLVAPQGWHADASWQAYILINNEFCKIEESATADIALYKAFLKVTDSFAPSVLRIVNGATNIENIEGNETAVKFIENGKLFIKKNGVVYDAVGTVVK